MHDENEKIEKSNASNSNTQMDLRSELRTNLIEEFTNNLKEAGTLTSAASESLVRKLRGDSLTSEDIIKALNLEDSTDTEVSNG
ncbi:MAG: hypothetical protein CME33_09330 [Gimesia sp.]|uniref:hypothetical protein n=1 Tax=Gimesia sp. TaxID=2024833 RepID=UPI000C3DDE78|nr:hypothetical protein [Gimesia sp.]MAX36751.1 hypothetical protein [Gimesia sp.]|tara:strand:- start:13331 stop:13582 length:252 start_codon:yes stop_codon:yes gene_type:complete